MEPPLSDTLSVLLPSDQETLFLQACLAGRARAADSWRVWLKRQRDFQAAFSGDGAALKQLLPLLHFKLAKSGVDIDGEVLAVLRAATIWEQRRAKRIREILSDALGLLAREGVTPVLLNGLALAETVYPQPALRHCHDVDLWVPLEDLKKGRDALTRSDFSGAPARKPHAVNMVHKDGLPINLIGCLAASSFGSSPECEMRRRAVGISFAAQPTKVLSPVDGLVQLCAQVCRGAVAEPTTWVVDATCLLTRFFQNPSDWDAAVSEADSRGLSLTLFVMLAYLRREIGLNVPDEVLNSVAAGATHSRRSHRDAVLAGARKTRQGRLEAMFRHSSWRSRAEIFRFLVLPSQAFLRGWCAERGLRWSPIWYVARPLRRLAMNIGIFRKTPSAHLRDRPTN